MIRKALARTISIAALTAGATTALVAGLPAPASALTGYQDGYRLVAQGTGASDGTVVDVGVNYLGTRTVAIKAVLGDRPGDVYCTLAFAALRGADGKQLGQTVALGSVCAGKTLPLPFKSITTQVGDVAAVQIWTKLGTTDVVSTNVQCFRGPDQHNGVLDLCR